MRQPLIITNKNLMTEWDYELNNVEGLYPDKLTLGSGRKAHFICSKSHKFYSIIASRKHNGCPECAKSHRVSIKEQTVFYYVKKNFKDAVSSYHAEWLGKKELDIYIPSINTAIEFDGERYHKNIVEDLQKDELCENNGIKLYHLRESGCPKSNKFKNQIIIKGYKESDLEETIKTLLKELNCKQDISLKNDNTKILNTIAKANVENSLATQNPKLAKEWNQELNGNLTPENVTCGSNLKVWWKGTCGHTWNASIRNRNKGRNCPYCQNLAALKGFNDAKTKIFNIEKYWDYKKNNKTPEEVVYTTREKFYITCPHCKNEEYTSLVNIANRCLRNQTTLCAKCNDKIARDKRWNR